MSLHLECIVPAGGRPEPGDDLWPHTGGRPKALLELADRPMVRWVIDALLAARSIERIILVGLERDDAMCIDRRADDRPFGHHRRAKPTADTGLPQIPKRHRDLHCRRSASQRVVAVHGPVGGMMSAE